MPWHERSIPLAALERLRAILVVPVVDAIVVRARVVRIDGEDLPDEELRADAVLGHRLVRVESLGLHVVGVLEDEAFERAVEVLARAAVRAPIFVLHLPGLDVVALARGAAGLAARGLAQERSRPVAAGRAREAPVGHRRVRVELDRPAEGAFGFEEPEGVEQRVPLIEPLLHFGLRRRDGKARAADAVDLRRTLARAFVERLAQL